jgi:hypothetical protein
MASTYLTYTQQSPSTAEGQKFTLSMWVKKTANTDMGLYGNTYSNTHRGYIYFDGNDRLSYYDSNGVNYTTTRVFRDNNSFYHIVVSVDTTLSTSSDRIKFYVNGVRETVFTNSSAPNQNDTLKIMNTTNTPNMGRMVEAGTSYYFQGVISHAHLTQGYTYDATPFGETDSTTGEWKIKTGVTGVTYGTNGFWWLKDTIATTDHSPNSNTFSVGGGTLTKTEDNPSNVFASGNILVKGSNDMTYGNTVQASGQASWETLHTTLGFSSGKFYAEFKPIALTNTYSAQVGIKQYKKITTFDEFVSTVGGASYQSHGNIKVDDVQQSYGSETAATTSDVIRVAADADNQKIYFGVNGTWLNSGDPTSGSTGTGAFAFPSGAGEVYAFAMGVIQGTCSANFGNGYFANNAVSSAGTNASGIGIFEYDVPTGYTALSTKGLNL